MSYNHRTHPAKRNKPGPGKCTWCLVPILKLDGTPNLRRTFCGPRCVTEYTLRTDPKAMRQYVFFRDDGKCAACNKQHFYMSGPWQADHIEPLFMAFGDRQFWEPENLQILCTDPCHKAKTAADRRKYGFVTKMAKGPATSAERSAKLPEKRVRLADRLA